MNNNKLKEDFWNLTANTEDLLNSELDIDLENSVLM